MVFGWFFLIESQHTSDPNITTQVPYQKLIDKFECNTRLENEEDMIGEKYESMTSSGISPLIIPIFHAK